MAPESVLVVQTAYLGDVVLTTPLLDALHRSWPKANLDVLVRPEFASLIRNHRSGASPRVLDKRGKDRGPIAAILAAARLGGNQYDIAVSPHRSLRTALTLRMAGIKQRIGFTDAVGAKLYTSTVKRDESLHDVERMLSLLPALGIDTPDKPELSLGNDREAAQRVSAIFVEAGIDRRVPLVGVNPGSVWATKRWMPERFAQMLDRISGELNLQTAILGGPQEMELCNRVADLCRTDVPNLAGRFDLSELVAAISKLALYVTNDSGPMHIAVALKVPVLAIFGSTVPEQGYAPYTSNKEIVQVEGMECRPCGPHGHQKCPLDHFDCMRKITVDKAMASLIMLARRNGVI